MAKGGLSTPSSLTSTTLSLGSLTITLGDPLLLLLVEAAAAKCRMGPRASPQTVWPLGWRSMEVVVKAAWVGRARRMVQEWGGWELQAW